MATTEYIQDSMETATASSMQGTGTRGECDKQQDIEVDSRSWTSVRIVFSRIGELNM